MTFSVKEIYFTLQGEGYQTGRPAVFLRFAGCNLWSGLERDRSSAVCRFCDTDFVGTDGPGGGKFKTAEDLTDAVSQHFPADFSGERLVVCTGGEPLLQLTPELIAALHARQIRIAIETNGTLKVPQGIDWICVSPKAGAELVQRSGDELKLVYPQAGVDPRRFEELDFRHFYVQPMDGPDQEANTNAAITWCKDQPKWQLSLQTHKLAGIP